MNRHICVHVSLSDQPQLVEEMLRMRENWFSTVPQLDWQTSACRGSMRKRIQIDCKQHLTLPFNRPQLGKQEKGASKWSEWGGSGTELESIGENNNKAQEGTEKTGNWLKDWEMQGKVGWPLDSGRHNQRFGVGWGLLIFSHSCEHHVGIWHLCLPRIEILPCQLHSVIPSLLPWMERSTAVPYHKALISTAFKNN